MIINFEKIEYVSTDYYTFSFVGYVPDISAIFFAVFLSMSERQLQPAEMIHGKGVLDVCALLFNSFYTKFKPMFVFFQQLQEQDEEMDKLQLRMSEKDKNIQDLQSVKPKAVSVAR